MTSSTAHTIHRTFIALAVLGVRSQVGGRNSWQDRPGSVLTVLPVLPALGLLCSNPLGQGSLFTQGPCLNVIGAVPSQAAGRGVIQGCEGPHQGFIQGCISLGVGFVQD